jgi:hypothetical protein
LVIDLLHGEVGQEAVRGGAVPVLLAGLKEHPVAGSDDLDRPAAALAEADTFRDVDGLAERVRVPRGPSTGREVDLFGGYYCGGRAVSRQAASSGCRTFNRGPR